MKFEMIEIHLKSDSKFSQVEYELYVVNRLYSPNINRISREINP